MWKGKFGDISAKNLMKIIGSKNSAYNGNDQQDCHEFLIKLIDWLDADLQTITVVEHVSKIFLNIAYQLMLTFHTAEQY